MGPTAKKATKPAKGSDKKEKVHSTVKKAGITKPAKETVKTKEAAKKAVAAVEKSWKGVGKRV